MRLLLLLVCNTIVWCTDIKPPSFSVVTRKQHTHKTHTAVVQDTDTLKPTVCTLYYRCTVPTLFQLCAQVYKKQRSKRSSAMQDIHVLPPLVQQRLDAHIFDTSAILKYIVAQVRAQVHACKEVNADSLNRSIDRSVIQAKHIQVIQMALPIVQRNQSMLLLLSLENTHLDWQFTDLLAYQPITSRTNPIGILGINKKCQPYLRTNETPSRQTINDAKDILSVIFHVHDFMQQWHLPSGGGVMPHAPAIQEWDEPELSIAPENSTSDMVHSECTIS